MKQLPPFSVGRPVLNLKPQHMSDLRYRLLERPGVDPDLPPKFFVPLGSVGITLVYAHEIKQLHEFLDHRPDKRHFLRLKTAINKKLSGSETQHKMSVATQPAQVRRAAKRTTKSGYAGWLGVANYPDAGHERRQVITAIEEFYDLPPSPGIWLGRNGKTYKGEVRLANARNQRQKRLLLHMADIINRGKSILPAELELGRVEVENAAYK